jgi:hypothetical protein
MGVVRKQILAYGIVAFFMASFPWTALADDICGGDDERRKLTAEARAAIATAEKSGKQAELFLAYQAAAGDDCIAKDLIEKARANMAKLGRDLAAKAEAKGLLYSKEPVAVVAGEQRRANEQASAFAWLEATGDFAGANRVMLKAVHAKPDDLKIFEAAWDADQNRRGPLDPKTGEQKPYSSPAAYRQELQKVASANANRLMKAEEMDAQGLAGNVAAVAAATMNSLDRLKKASEWMKFLPDGDKPARARAEQRGDTIMKRPDPTFTQMNAKAYYEFAGSAKAKAAAKQVEAKQAEFGRAAEKSAEKVKGSLTQKSEADQQKFKKGKEDLEKELGF